MPQGVLAWGERGCFLWDSSYLCGAWTSALASSVDEGGRGEGYAQKADSAVSALAVLCCAYQCHHVPGLLSHCPTEMPPCQVSLLHRAIPPHLPWLQDAHDQPSAPVTRILKQLALIFTMGGQEGEGEGRLSKLLLREERSTEGQRVWDRCLASGQDKLGKYSPKISQRNLPKCEHFWLQVV